MSRVVIIGSGASAWCANHLRQKIMDAAPVLLCEVTVMEPPSNPLIDDFMRPRRGKGEKARAARARRQRGGA